MSELVTRLGKGSSLTHQEMDNNLLLLQKGCPWVQRAAGSTLEPFKVNVAHATGNGHLYTPASPEEGSWFGFVNPTTKDPALNILYVGGAQLPLDVVTGNRPVWIRYIGGAWVVSDLATMAGTPWALVGDKPAVIASGADMATARAAIEAVSLSELEVPFVAVTGTLQAALPGTRYGLANVEASTLTLPPAPALYATVYVVVLNGRYDNKLTGGVIGGLAEDMVIDDPRIRFEAIYVGGTIGWLIV